MANLALQKSIVPMKTRCPKRHHLGLAQLFGDYIFFEPHFHFLQHKSYHFYHAMKVSCDPTKVAVKYTNLVYSSSRKNTYFDIETV